MFCTIFNFQTRSRRKSMQYYLLGIAIGIVLMNVLYINITVWEVQK